METTSEKGAGFRARSAFANNTRRPVEREWLTQKEVANYIGVKVMTVWRYEHGYTDERGQYHPPRDGYPKASTALGRKKWRKADIEAFMASQIAA